MIAERLAVAPDDENAMDRGIRLESEAVKLLEKETGKSFINEMVIWQREDNENIAISPDAYSEDETEAVEVKCLVSARHIEVLLTKEVPADHKDQVLQYFIVNDKLQRLYFCCYDPRMSVKKFFNIVVERKDIEIEIKKNLEYEKNMLVDVECIVNSLSF